MKTKKITCAEASGVRELGHNNLNSNKSLFRLSVDLGIYSGIVLPHEQFKTKKLRPGPKG